MDFDSHAALASFFGCPAGRKKPCRAFITRCKADREHGIMAIRAARIEIFGFAKERRDAWKELAVACQRMTNRLWQVWLCHHANNGSADKLRSHFDAYKAWQETKRGDKPQWPCKAVEEPLTKSADARSFYRIMSAEFSSVNVRTRGLLTNAWQSKVNTRKAASGSLPGWVSILFGNESLPSFTRPQPIPFDRDNAKLFKQGDKYICELRIERLADGKSVVEPCELMLAKRKCASVRSTVEKIIAGEYAWKGSSLIYDRGKWFVSIAYEMPNKVREKLSADRVLYVRPAKTGPWRVAINGRGSWRFGGNGAHVEHARRAIIRERNSRKTHYRWSGSNQKGHGRRRADAVWTKLSSRWKDFTKRYNNEVSKQVVNLAIREGCGRIVYLQPRDENREGRYLSTVGNDRISAMSWDYFQFGTMLASKCESEGIEYGKKPKPPKKPKATTNGVRGVRKVSDPKRGDAA
jgi:hypothetical protein